MFSKVTLIVIKAGKTSKDSTNYYTKITFNPVID